MDNVKSARGISVFSGRPSLSCVPVQILSGTRFKLGLCFLGEYAMDVFVNTSWYKTPKMYVGVCGKGQTADTRLEPLV